MQLAEQPSTAIMSRVSAATNIQKATCQSTFAFLCVSTESNGSHTSKQALKIQDDHVR